ncbi:hypothetical protein T440DRAFT_552849 [Plenodomus tracheiphilus IPT5]|uniref:Uncharacterized protein n=1 Tax=Plenodomus tracheiphilus IPT5 TaxID=1408161 RepID=A0A6A7BE23_9PLEO|nr:hypothetical protein T440DRAFT_552849 [Plenodomus tracheiphilus IPT5]
MLLGWPIGATLAFMLLQHKAQLGVKHVGKIFILGTKLGSDGFIWVHMGFEFGDVANPQDVDIDARSGDGESKAENTETIGGYLNGARTHSLIEHAELNA